MSDEDRRPEVGVPLLAPTGNEQPGQQQADDHVDPLSQNLFQGQDEDATPIPEGESGAQDGRGNPPVVEEAKDGDEDEGNAVGRELLNAETMNPAVDDQGNAVGVSGSTAETMNPAEEGQGKSVGNGQPIAGTMTPAASSSSEQPKSTSTRFLDLVPAGTGNLARRFSRQVLLQTPAGSIAVTPQRLGTARLATRDSPRYHCYLLL